MRLVGCVVPMELHTRRVEALKLLEALEETFVLKGP